MGGSIGDFDHSANPSTINNCCVGSRADHLYNNVDGEILGVSRGGDRDCIARCSQRNRTPDSLAGSSVTCSCGCYSRSPHSPTKCWLERLERRMHREQLPSSCSFLRGTSEMQLKELPELVSASAL